MANNQNTGGISFAAIVGLTFIVLKLCKVISWSWWWVTAPFWIPLAIALVLYVFGKVLIEVGKRK